MARNTFQAVLISPDGQDYVEDFDGRKTIKEVWDAVNDMGSRWIFYPLVFVVNERTGKIRSGCNGLEQCEGFTIPEVKSWLQDTEIQKYVEYLLS